MDVNKGYSIVPTVILEDNNITDKQLRLYIKISSLVAGTGECWASDTYFAEKFNVNKSTISKNINALYRNGYIGKNNYYKKGTKTIEKRIITLTPPTQEILDIGYSKKSEGGIVNNGGDNSISNNNITTNVEKKPTATQLSSLADDIFNHYVSNTQLEKRHQYPSKTKILIKKALSSFNKEQLIGAVDSYFNVTDKKYRLSPVKFFNPNSKDGKDLYLDYTEDKKTQATITSKSIQNLSESELTSSINASGGTAKWKDKNREKLIAIKKLPEFAEIMKTVQKLQAEENKNLYL